MLLGFCCNNVVFSSGFFQFTMYIRPLFWILVLGMIQLSIMHPLAYGNRSSTLSIPTRRVAKFRDALERAVIKLLIKSKNNPGFSLPRYYKWRPLLGWCSPIKTFIEFGIIRIPQFLFLGEFFFYYYFFFLVTRYFEIKSKSSVVQLI